MADPPVVVGAAQLTVMPFAPALAATRIGAPGTVTGVAVRLFEAGLVPTALVAVTVTAYVVPFTSPLMLQPSWLVVQLAPPGEAVAVYAVIAEPPLLDGAFHAAPIVPSPAVSDVRTGAPGAVGCGPAFARTMTPLLSSAST